MTPSGHSLTLNFYSNEIDVLIDKHGDIFVDWDHYQLMLGISIDRAVPLQEHAESLYVSLSYLQKNPMIEADTTFYSLVIQEFIPYVGKELGIIRALIPTIEMDSTDYDIGIFEYDGKQYILESKLPRVLGHLSVSIPDDVPRRAVIVTVRSLYKGLTRDPQQYTSAFVWLLELNSLPYILQVSKKYHEQHRILTNGHGYEHYTSPGKVGTSRCELDTSKVMKVQPFPGEEMNP